MTGSKNQPNPLEILELQELKIRRLVGQVPDLPRRDGSQPHQGRSGTCPTKPGTEPIEFFMKFRGPKAHPNRHQRPRGAGPGPKGTLHARALGTRVSVTGFGGSHVKVVIDANYPDRSTVQRGAFRRG